MAPVIFGDVIRALAAAGEGGRVRTCAAAAALPATAPPACAAAAAVDAVRRGAYATGVHSPD